MLIDITHLFVNEYTIVIMHKHIKMIVKDMREPNLNTKHVRDLSHS